MTRELDIETALAVLSDSLKSLPQRRYAHASVLAALDFLGSRVGRK
jgi:hypothetical protein